MKFYFEQFQYSHKPEIDDNYLYETLQGWVIDYVGFFFNVEHKEPVFILPKVFIDENNLAFGKFNPDTMYDSASLEDCYEEDKKAIVTASIWLYQAIAKYVRENPKETIAADDNIQNVVSEGDDGGSSFLDKIISLVDFGRKHKTLFLYISKILHSGNNKIDWRKTISTTQPIFQNGYPIYLNFKNKKKVINYDEELIVLFYSTLAYLNKEYCFKVDIAPGYELLPANRIQSMIENRLATRRLRTIRHNYFTDELVSLWNILFAFYEQAEKIAYNGCHNDVLLVKNFNIVFEAMVDKLVGQEILNPLRHQKDGKRLDHIYEDRSILEIDNTKIYCIGDSKYYKDTTQILGTSQYKQYTYAKNVIQYNIDILNLQKETEKRQEWLGNFRYRDELTEGYDVTPNFFIRGKFFPGCYDFYDEHLDDSKEQFPVNLHFKNRLFDRDTLILKSYDINFLFVLSSYVSGVDESIKKRIRKKFRDDFVDELKRRYDFYLLLPIYDNLWSLVERHFYRLCGKVFRPRGREFLILALEKKPEKNPEKFPDLEQSNKMLLEKIDVDFLRYPYNLDYDTNYGNKTSVASQSATSYNEDEYWIKAFSEESERIELENAQHIQCDIAKSKAAVKYVILYNQEYLSSYFVYKVLWNANTNQFDIVDMTVEFPDLQLELLLTERKEEIENGFLKKSVIKQYCR